MSVFERDRPLDQQHDSLSKGATQGAAVKKCNVCCGTADGFVVKVGMLLTCTVEWLVLLVLALHDADCCGLESHRVSSMRMIHGASVLFPT